MNAPRSTAQPRAPRRVSFWERAFRQGEIIGVNSYRVQQTPIRELLTHEGYQLNTTPHFLVGTRPHAPTLILQCFAPAAIDADLGRILLEELKPLGLLPDSQHFADVYGALVGSLFPKDSQRAWHLFGANTLRRYRQLLAEDCPPPQVESHIACFAMLYRRVCELVVGERLLEAGCSSGFFPLVLAERRPSMTHIVGVDRETSPFPVARLLAAERNLTTLRFVQADLLTDDLHSLGRFSTVTALHVLEHFREADMYRVLSTLFQRTTHRLLIAVPYERGEPEAAFGHEQLFSRERLEALGRWCLIHLGASHFSYEDCAGGLLVVERASA